MTDTKAAVSCDRCGRPLDWAYKLSAQHGQSPPVYIGTYGRDCRRAVARQLAKTAAVPLDTDSGRPIYARA